MMILEAKAGWFVEVANQVREPQEPEPVTRRPMKMKLSNKEAADMWRLDQMRKSD